MKTFLKSFLIFIFGVVFSYCAITVIVNFEEIKGDISFFNKLSQEDEYTLKQISGLKETIRFDLLIGREVGNIFIKNNESQLLYQSSDGNIYAMINNHFVLNIANVDNNRITWDCTVFPDVKNKNQYCS